MLPYLLVSPNAPNAADSPIATPIAPAPLVAPLSRADLGSLVARIPPKVLRRMSRFLRAYSKSGVILDGLQAANLTRTGLESWRSRYLVWPLIEAEAREAATDELERHLIRRATRGVPQPIVAGGRIIGHRRTPSDNLLMFALKGARPGKYKEKLLDGSDLVTLLQRVGLAISRVRGDVVEAELIGATPAALGEETQETTKVQQAIAPNVTPPKDDDDAPALASTPAARALLSAVYVGARAARAPRPRPDVPRGTPPATQHTATQQPTARHTTKRHTPRRKLT